jgi:hypothetical protein
MKRFLFLLAFSLMILAAAGGIVMAQETEEEPFVVIIDVAGGNELEPTFWVEWNDSQKRRIDETYQYQDHYVYEELLVIIGRYEVRAFNLSVAGEVEEIELAFANSATSDASRFLLLDSTQSIVGRLSALAPSEESMNYTITLEAYTITAEGTAQITAQALPCGIMEPCPEATQEPS